MPSRVIVRHAYRRVILFPLGDSTVIKAKGPLASFFVAFSLFAVTLGRKNCSASLVARCSNSDRASSTFRVSGMSDLAAWL